jgi:hypothetical protein
MSNEISRRKAVGAAAVAGAVALMGLSQQSDAQTKPAASPDDAERQRMMAIGFTEAEAECWLLTSKAAGKFFELPKLHAMDDQEVATAVHVVQNKLLSRPTYRKYKEQFNNP